MNKKAVLAGLGSGIVAGVLLALVVLNIAAPIAPSDQLGGTIGVKLVVQIHRSDGTVEVIEKEGDLMLLNFAKFLVFLLGPEVQEYYTVKQTDGNVRWIKYLYYSNNAYIVFGTNNNDAELNDYAINEVGRVTASASYIVNGTDMIIDVSGSWLPDSNYTITEIGLIKEFKYEAGVNTYTGEALLFRDVITDPIEVHTNETVTVHYYILLDNP